MNKFKNSIDKIQMNENDKKRVLNNILNHKKKKNTFNVFIYRFATFLLIFGVAFGSGYALNKIFKLDDKIVEFLGLDEKTKEQIELNGEDINIVKHYDNYDINFRQVIIGYNTIDFIFDMENIKNDASLKYFIVTKGDIDESKIITSKVEFADDIILDPSIELSDADLTEIFYEDNSNNGSGGALIEEFDNKLSYLTYYSQRSKITSGEYNLRIYDNNLEYHDIKFNITNTNIKTIDFNDKVILYNKDNIKVINDKMIITNSDIYIEATSDQLEQINNLEYDILNFSEIKIKTKDDNIIDVAGSSDIEDNKIKMYMSYYNDFIDINNIKSLIINDIEIKISD